MEAWRPAILAALFLVAGTIPIVGLLDDDPAAVEQSASSDEEDDARNDFLLSGTRPAVNAQVSGGSEPAIITDADDPDLLWIGDTTGIYRSTDGGSTWDSLAVPFRLVADGIGLAQDDTGAIYATTTDGAAIQFARSDDHGTIWSATPLAPAPSAQGVDAGGVADRPWMAAHGDGKVAVIWNPGTNPPGTRCVASADGGLTWPDRGAAKSSIISGDAEFDDQGNLYWAVRGTVYRQQTTSAIGPTPGLTCPLAAERVTPVSVGSQAMPQVAALQDGVVYAAPSPDESELVIAATDNWPLFSTVNLDPTDETTGNSLETNTFVTVSATQNEVAIAWYGTETAGDPTSASFDGAWNVYVAQIANVDQHDDETLTCSNADVTCTRATTEANHVGPICMSGVTCTTDRDLLDYFMLDHGADGAVHVAYAHDGTSSDAHVRYAQVPAS